ncbi:hypothetical protein [uncultured Roseibium sp.]|uniref:hypothetical protein n=1 Tax=uncultured Roseibium sp. TaxID=1936171 RepID=UPI002619255B|nr:hypothetical protein [uncultured Roseibium sp.]
MAENNISMEAESGNVTRRSFLRGTAAGVATVPAVAVSASSVPVAAMEFSPLTSTYQRWRSLDASASSLWNKFEYLESAETPGWEEAEKLLDEMADAPGETAFDIVVKLAVAHRRDADWVESKLMLSAGAEAEAYLEARGFVPEPVVFTPEEMQRAADINEKRERECAARVKQKKAEEKAEAEKAAQQRTEKPPRRGDAFVQLFDTFVKGEDRKIAFEGIRCLMQAAH